MLKLLVVKEFKNILQSPKFLAVFITSFVLILLSIIVGIMEYKTNMNFIYEPNKFERAGLTEQESELVNAPRVKECPVQLEGVVKRSHHFGPKDSHAAGIEVDIIRVHIEESLLNDEKRHYIDSDKWKPLIMSFCEFYGTGDKLQPSRLAKVF